MATTWREVEALIKKHGWRLARQTEHKQYVHDTIPGVISINRKNPGADVPPGTLNSILKTAHLKGDEAR